MTSGGDLNTFQTDVLNAEFPINASRFDFVFRVNNPFFQIRTCLLCGTFSTDLIYQN